MWRRSAVRSLRHARMALRIAPAAGRRQQLRLSVVKSQRDEVTPSKDSRLSVHVLQQKELKFDGLQLRLRRACVSCTDVYPRTLPVWVLVDTPSTMSSRNGTRVLWWWW